MAKRVVLAYSGGLDTSVAVRWMIDNLGVEVIALAVDVGQTSDDWDVVRERALAAGAVEAIVVDCREEFARDFLAPALKANALYEGRYPLVSALSRPVIVRHLVAAARYHGADAVAHGCTGKGNDQVRFEVATRALAPDLEILAPVRDQPLARAEEVAFLQTRGLPVPAHGAAYSVNRGLWGATIGGRETLTSDGPLPESEWLLTRGAFDAPRAPERHRLAFEAGVPAAWDGEALGPVVSHKMARLRESRCYSAGAI